MTDLLPCPFCGSTDVHIGEDYYIYGSCDDCGAQGPAFEPERTCIPGRAMHVYDTKAAEAKAVEAWNRRAPSLFVSPIIERQPQYERREYAVTSNRTTPLT